jgi:hypothetical protein
MNFRQVLGRTTLRVELCVSLNLDSYYLNAALRGFAIDIVAVARRHRQAQQLATVCRRSET